MRRRVLPLSFALGVSACGIDSGGDYAVSATWLFNGLEPTQEVCDDYGVDRIRLRITSSTHDRTLEAPCNRVITLSDDYQYGGFDTKFSFTYEKNYSFEVAMLDKRGNVVSLQGNPLSYEGNFNIDDYSVSYYELRPLELFDPFGSFADIEASYTIDRRVPTAASCADEGIATVYLDIASATDPDFADYQAVADVSCEEGFISAPATIARGEYFFRYVAAEADGRIISTFVPTDNGQDATVYTLKRPGLYTIDQVDLP